MAEGDPKIGQVDPWGGNPITPSTSDDLVPTLYHAVTSWCSQFVRLVLEEEGVGYHSRLVDIHKDREQVSPWYAKINPNMEVPVLVHKGQPLFESKDIVFFVMEEITQAHKLLPSEKKREVKDLVERFYSEVRIEPLTVSSGFGSKITQWLLGLILPDHVRRSIHKIEEMKKSNPELTEILDNKAKAMQTRKIGRCTKKSNQLEKVRDLAFAAMQSFLDQLESNLDGNQYVCGNQYSIADCLITCLMARLKMISLLDGVLSKRPNLGRWWDMVHKRPSYKAAGLVDEPPFGVGQMAKNMCHIM